MPSAKLMAPSTNMAVCRPPRSSNSAPVTYGPAPSSDGYQGKMTNITCPSLKRCRYAKAGACSSYQSSADWHFTDTLGTVPHLEQSKCVGARLFTGYAIPGRARTAEAAQCTDAVEDGNAHGRALAVQEGLGPAPPASTCGDQVAPYPLIPALAMREGLGPAPPASTCGALSSPVDTEHRVWNKTYPDPHPSLLQAARRACMKAHAPKLLPERQCIQEHRLKAQVKLSCGRTWGRERPTRPWPQRSGGRNQR